MKHPISLSQEELRRRYIDEGQTLALIAAEIGCSAATVSNMLRRHGIPARAGHFTRRDIPRDLLVQLYSVEGVPVKDIAARFGVTLGTITNRRREYGIPRRPRKRPGP